jgi:hypothetical protein
LNIFRTKNLLILAIPLLTGIANTYAMVKQANKHNEHILYAGKIDEKTYFEITKDTKPHGKWYIVKIGSKDNLKEVPVANSWRTRELFGEQIIQLSTGFFSKSTFHFPRAADAADKKATATYNGKKVEVTFDAPLQEYKEWEAVQKVAMQSKL